MKMARFFAVLLLLPLVGCVDSSSDLAPVSGRITLDGEPLAGAEVIFLPLLPGFEYAPESVAVTATDGTYQLEVFNSGKRGAVVGRHRVEIRLGEVDTNEVDGLSTSEKAMRNESDCLPPRYNDESHLEFEVRPVNVNQADFDLKSNTAN
jgi:hypothetical protein